MTEELIREDSPSLASYSPLLWLNMVFVAPVLLLQKELSIKCCGLLVDAQHKVRGPSEHNCSLG